MNRIKSAIILPLLAFVLAGCATTNSANGPKLFSEEASVNAVLQFSSWDYTFLTQPRYDDGGFLLQVPRDGVAQVLDKVNMHQRDLAVVVIGWNQNPEQLRELTAEWKKILGSCGFRRVVLVKSNGKKKLNGSIIIDDSTFETPVAARL